MSKLITNPTNIAYLSGFTGSAGFILQSGSKNYLFTDSRYIERAADSLKPGFELIDITRVWRNPKELATNWQKILKKHSIKTLGIEEDHLTLKRFKHYKKISKGLKFKDISGEIESLREIKTPQEIKLITKSQRINEKVFSEIKKIVQKNPKATEIELNFKIKELAQKYGAEDVSFDPIVAFGKNSSRPHHLSGKSKRKKDDIILIDMGVKYQGYCSDMTRTFFVGKPTAKQLEIYNLVLKAQKHAINHIKAGITGKKADQLSRKIIEEAGYDDQYSHAGGHGIGLDIHEQPSLSQNYKKTLKANSIITVEPGIYLPGQFGVRIEDMLLLTKTGNKNLTKITK